ncbi:hypothetical protein [Demequina iriomotensis]|uniref:hypothetical protein n=1 Tax=Demequina iriomotensis TaxID=1536641 RepID=UPI000785D4AE|nr:hypothetical protein [Demequina iriomotensis]
MRASAVDQVRGRGVSMECNRFGHYAVALGVAAILGAVAVHVLGSTPWVAVVAAIAAARFGSRGWNAAERGFATNRGTAGAGLALGLAALVALAARAVLDAIEASAVL